MYGKALFRGLHQAIEAKEGVKVAAESKTLATITSRTIQDVSEAAGMTGTAMTEAEEFSAIYKLDIVEIPTNRPMIRIDNNDVIYKTRTGNTRQLSHRSKSAIKRASLCFVGTISIEKSEVLSALLKKKWHKP
jgi:preprotein translocase subunit SecA